MRSALIGLLVLGTSVAVAQDVVGPRFEVTSVKANTSGQSNVGGPGDRFSNGQFQTTNIPLRLLVRQAFERYLQDDVVGGPAWLDNDRWNIVAKAESPGVPMLPMIQLLLVDRFKLVSHIESRERPVYALEVVTAGRLGASLKPATGSSSFLGTTGTVRGRSIPLALLSTLLGGAVGRPVLDRTGLAGTYDVDLRYTPALGPAATPEAETPDAPDVFTAVREQLGLRLVSTRGPVPILVIDSAEKPSPD